VLIGNRKSIPALCPTSNNDGIDANYFTVQLSSGPPELPG